MKSGGSSPQPLSAAHVLDREFLELRAKLLELAASLDRIERGAGSVAQDPRLEAFRQGLDVLVKGEPARAEAIQMIFSRPYQSKWQEEFARQA